MVTSSMILFGDIREVYTLPAETQEPEPDHHGLLNCNYDDPKLVDQVCLLPSKGTAKVNMMRCEM